jgi:plasmid stabilization system protein ParE
VKVELSEQADGQVKRIDAWWRANRLAAPDLFTDEVEAAFAALGETPTLGVGYEGAGQPVRRVLLPRTHYHLYFTQEADRLLVVALWSAFRGRGPKL